MVTYANTVFNGLRHQGTCRKVLFTEPDAPCSCTTPSEAIKGYAVRLSDGQYIGRRGVHAPYTAVPFAFAATFGADERTRADMFAAGWIGHLSGGPSVAAIVPLVSGPKGYQPAEV